MRSLWSPEPLRSPGACVLVVDDDRRVVDLLTIALAAHGFRVLGAADGEEALRVAAAKRPDLVVLDVRLPKKSGFEVCEVLRRDPEDPDLPIIMVSAATESEARLQGFARGADDYLAKPFSPKELIARMKRLLVRATDARESRRRGREAEQELVRAREDARRAHAELGREQRLRRLGAGIARDLHGALDEDELAGRVLLAVRTQLGVGVAALLTSERPGGTLVPFASRGDGLERFAGAEVRPDSELAGLLAGMGRPVRREELERFPDLARDLGPFIVGGVSILAPLTGEAGLEGVLLAGERSDGRDLTALELDVLALLCESAAGGLANARRCRTLADGLMDTLIGHAAPSDAAVSFQAEAAALAAGAARMLLIPPRLRDALSRGVELGGWAESPHGRQALGRAATSDPSGRLADVVRLLHAGAEPGAEDGDAHQHQAAVLLRVARAYDLARRQGRDPGRALDQAIASAGAALDPAVRQTLIGMATGPSSGR